MPRKRKLEVAVIETTNQCNLNYCLSQLRRFFVRIRMMQQNETIQKVKDYVRLI